MQHHQEEENPFMSSDKNKLQKENIQDGQTWSAAQPEDPIPRPLLKAAINLILMREISLSLLRDADSISYGMHVPLCWRKGYNKYIVPGNVLNYQMTQNEKKYMAISIFQ